MAQPAHMGAMPSVFAAVGDPVSGGGFYGPEGLGQVRGYPVRVESSRASHDEVAAALVFEYWHDFVAGTRSRDELRHLMKSVQHNFEALLRRIVAADICGLSGSCANLLAHAPALWTFVDVPGVEPTNNLAERDLRSLVIWRKLCYGCQSERGLRFVERVMTVCMTLRKRQHDVLDFIEQCVRARAAGSPVPSLPKSVAAA